MLAAMIVFEVLHVVLAIFWFGSILFFDLVLIPVVVTLPGNVQKSLGGPLAARMRRTFRAVGGLVILLGFLRGVVGGVLGSLNTAYGITFLVALVLGVGLVAYGEALLSPKAERFQSLPPGPEYDAALSDIRLWTMIELLLFAVLFTLMIAMRFGY